MAETHPSYVITAQHDDDEDDSKMAKLEAKIAKMSKDMDEMKKGKKANHEDDSKMATEGHDGRTIPVVQAMKKAMEDDDLDDAQKAAIKATMEVFNTGNGVNKANIQHEPATKVKEAVKAQIAEAIRPYEQKAMRPIIVEVLQANINAGATEEQIKILEKALTAKTLEELETYKAENAILLANAMKSADMPTSSNNAESMFGFNGETTTPLIASGGMSNIDNILGGSE